MQRGLGSTRTTLSVRMSGRQITESLADMVNKHMPCYLSSA